MAVGAGAEREWVQRGTEQRRFAYTWGHSWLFARKCLVCLLANIRATRHDLDQRSVLFVPSAREMSVFVLFVWSVWSVWSLFSFHGWRHLKNIKSKKSEKKWLLAVKAGEAVDKQTKQTFFHMLLTRYQPHKSRLGEVFTHHHHQHEPK